MAAGIQAGIGNVVAGSLFATAQSVAMGGAIPAIITAIGGGVGAVGGVAAAGATSVGAGVVGMGAAPAVGAGIGAAAAKLAAMGAASAIGAGIGPVAAGVVGKVVVAVLLLPPPPSYRNSCPVLYPFPPLCLANVSADLVCKSSAVESEHWTQLMGVSKI